MSAELQSQLLAIQTALVKYDQRQSTKRGYNIYALSHYLRAFAHVRYHAERGEDLRRCIGSFFLDRVADACLRAVKLPLLTREECKFGFPNRLPEPPEAAEEEEAEEVQPIQTESGGTLYPGLPIRPNF